ncbi:MAG: sigma 54-interacting transcriptional regulator [Holophagales bacterium]|nr:sigma 54-interacting transcriptional regulator [Holophagales bacterium]
MSTTRRDVPDPPETLCLRGKLEGEERSWPLPPGEHTVGSSGEHTVFLPVRGVSRRHARLEAADNRLKLHDLGSVNGTFLGAERVETATASPGDEVRFGPVRLRLDSVEPADATLGLALELSRAEPTVFSAVTSFLPEDRYQSGAADLPTVDAVVGRLGARPDADLPGALVALAHQMGARGAALVEWPATAPVVVSSGGEVGRVPRRPELERHAELIRAGARRAGPGHWLGPGAENGPIGPIWRRRGQDPLALLLWPASPEVPPDSPEGSVPWRSRQRLLSTLLQLLEAFRSPALEEISSLEAARPPGLEVPPGIVIGDSPAMAGLYHQLRSLVNGDLPVLILGETGVGKEHLARMLHLSSTRAERSFVAVNCAAIPESQLEAEMFGVGEGAATGVEPRRGAFRSAHGGTLLLDELGEMPLPLQAKLLRAIQEGEVMPVGAHPERIDVRVLAATNRDLSKRVKEGSFRADLYFRLAGFELEVPPLRQRPEDLPLLLGHFLRRFAKRLGKRIPGVTVKALRALSTYSWPGNVRELEHEVRRIVHLCPEGQAIDSSMLTPRVAAGRDADGESDPSGGLEEGLVTQVEALERRLIRLALTRTAGNQTRAAKLLRVSRSGFLKRLERLGIDSAEFLP